MRDTRYATLSVVLTVLLFLAPALLRADGLIYPPAGQYSDLTITHWPAFQYLRDTLAEGGAFPLWRTSILGGTPFAADPASGVWYPPNWLSLVLPLEWFFKLVIAAHLLLAGWAMARLARTFGMAWIGATAAGVAYAVAPRVAAHIGAGHVTLVEAWAWIPVAAWTLRERRWWATSAMALGMCALADMRAAVFAVPVSAAFALIQPPASGARPVSRWVTQPWRLAATLVLAAWISAAVWLPALSLSSESTRASLRPGEASVFSLPPSHFLGMLIAGHDNPEYVTFTGLTVLLLGLIGLRAMWRSNRRAAIGLSTLIAIAVVVALGSNTPLYELLYRLPGVSLLRVPARAWIVVAFATALLCGAGVDALAGQLSETLAKKWKLAGWLAGSFALLFGVGGAAMAFSSRQPGAAQIGSSLIGLAIFAPSTIVLVMARATGRLSSIRFGAIALALIAIELIWVGGSYYRVVPRQAVFDEGRAAAEYITAVSGDCVVGGISRCRQSATGVASYRIYSPSYSVPQHVAQMARLETVDGINPLQLERTVRFMQRATGVGEWGYSVTLPAFEGMTRDEDLRTLLSAVVPDPKLLGVLNVRHVVAHFPIPHTDLIEVARLGGAIVYENARVLPRAWVVGHVDAVADQSQALDWLSSRDLLEEAVVENGRAIRVDVDSHAAQMVSRQPDRIEVSARGPGLLVLSEVYERDWRASIDGQAAVIYPTNAVLRGVYLPEGEHRVEFVYDPFVVKVSTATSGIGMAGWLVGWLVSWMARRRQRV
ncbi:MAG TPA: hypothetical protein VJ754_09930 [Anaerolineae bacterium]|nr:hypothetical protein [Anaerolineae bacterium]